MTRVMAAFFAAAALASAAADDPLRTLRPGHPRLILLDPEIDRARLLMQQNPLARRIHLDLIREAERVVAAPTAEYRLAGQRLSAQTRASADRLYTLALLYRLDGRTPFRDRAVQEMRALADFKDWNPAFLFDTAELTAAFAVAYDWLYNALTPEQREWMRAALIEKGLSPAISAYQSQQPWLTARNTWNEVCNSGFGIGALAVAEDEPEKSRTVLQSALDSIPHALTAYAPDGSWAEGPCFWHSGTGYAVSWMAALESALGTDFHLSAAQGFEHTGRFRVYFTGPSGRSFNYAETHEPTESAPEMFWLARRFNEPAYAWQEQHLLQSGTAPVAMDLVWFQAEARSPKQENWPLNAIFHEGQVAFLRSAWDDPNALFIGIRGGDNKTHHGHLDLGQFVLDGGGVRWALDSGPEDFSSAGAPPRPRGAGPRVPADPHNTLLVDDEGQDPRAEAAIGAHFFSPDSSWVELDLSRAYRRLQSYRRRIGITQGLQFFVEDLAEADHPVEVLWSMLTDAAASLSGQSAELQKNGWTLSAEILSPRHAVFDLAPGMPPAGPAQNAALKKLVVRLGDKVTRLDLKITLTLHRTGQPAPKIIPKFGS